jgi:hypothetical protein
MMPAIPRINVVVDVTLLVIAVGLIVRGRWRLSVVFAAYIPCVLLQDLLVVLWPERFYSHSFWLISQSVLDALTFGVALEAGWRTFGAFPGAAAVARTTGLLILAATAIALASLPLASPDSTSTQTALISFHPRLNDGTIWLIAAMLVIARWYRVPVHRFHAALLTSLAVYLVFFTWLLRSFAGHDFEAARYYMNALDPVGFLLVTWWWMHVTWRAENGADRTHLGVLKTLQLRAG